MLYVKSGAKNNKNALVNLSRTDSISKSASNSIFFWQDSDSYITFNYDNEKDCNNEFNRLIEILTVNKQLIKL